MTTPAAPSLLERWETKIHAGFEHLVQDVHAELEAHATGLTEAADIAKRVADSTVAQRILDAVLDPKAESLIVQMVDALDQKAHELTTPAPEDNGPVGIDAEPDQPAS